MITLPFYPLPFRQRRTREREIYEVPSPRCSELVEPIVGEDEGYINLFLAFVLATKFDTLPKLYLCILLMFLKKFQKLQIKIHSKDSV
jgi:hypothetical protein